MVFFKGLFSLWKIGTKTYLIFLYTILYFVFILDFYTFDYNINALKYIYFDLNYFIKTISFFISIIISFPIIIGIFRVIFGPIHSKSNIFDKIFNFKNSFSNFIIGLFSLIIAFLFYITFFYINLKGISLNSYNNKMTLISPLYYHIGMFAINYFNFPALFAMLGGIFTTLFQSNNETINEFWTKVKLIDLNGDFYPIHKRRVLSFNNGAITPRIKYIDKVAKKIIHKYHLAIPGSKKAKDFLHEIYLDIVDKIENLLFKDSSGFDIELYSLTTRSFDVILQELGNNLNIIYTSFEHPTIIKHIENYCNNTVNSNKIVLKKELILSESNEDDTLIKVLIPQIENVIDTKKKNVLIISEVFYATGKIIPVKKIIDLLKNKYKNFITIVDGAQSIGNIQAAFRVNYDYLFFSAQKWLLSPVPMGILLKRSSNHKKIFYDTWHESDIPYATIDINEIAHFYASLELIDKIGLSSIHNRQIELINLFKKKLNSTKKFKILYKNTDKSSIVSIIPNDREYYKWRETSKKELIDMLENDLNIYGSIIDFKYNGRYILRLTFSYYLDVSIVADLVKKLEKAVRKT